MTGCPTNCPTRSRPHLPQPPEPPDQCRVGSLSLGLVDEHVEHLRPLCLDVCVVSPPTRGLGPKTPRPPPSREAERGLFPLVAGLGAGGVEQVANAKLDQRVDLTGKCLDLRHGLGVGRCSECDVGRVDGQRGAGFGEQAPQRGTVPSTRPNRAARAVEPSHSWLHDMASPLLGRPGPSRFSQSTRLRWRRSATPASTHGPRR